MTVFFSDDELEWIDKEPFNWHIKEGCPASLIKPIQDKLDAIYKERQEVAYGQNRRTNNR